MITASSQGARDTAPGGYAVPESVLTNSSVTEGRDGEAVSAESAGYRVPRRAVLAGPVAVGVLAWARRLAGAAGAETNGAQGWVGGPGNVRVSRDAFTMHAEPSLAANPIDLRNLLAACMVWRAPQRGPATYASFDEGSTWHSNGLLPGVTPAYDGDVTVAFYHQGTGYVSGWAGRRAHLQRGRVCLWRTGDGGRSFTAPVTVTTRPFNPLTGTQQGWIGDYQGLTATPVPSTPLERHPHRPPANRHRNHQARMKPLPARIKNAQHGG